MPKKDLEMQNELLRIREEEIKAALEAYKLKAKEDRAIAVAAEQDRIAKEGIIGVDQKGNPIDIWNPVREKIESALASERLGYQDWQAAMTSTFDLMVNLSKALTHTRKELITGPLGIALVNGVQLTDPFFIETVPKFLGIPSPGPVIPLPGLADAYDPLMEKIKSTFIGNPEVDLPVLEHSVQFNEKNELDIKPLIRSDNVDLAPGNKLDQLFEKGVVAWLDKIGYTRKPGTKNEFIDKIDGTALTKDLFENKKEDPNQGLHAFLTDRFVLSFSSKGLGK